MFAEFVLEKRPTLSKGSVSTYASLLKNLYKKLFGDDVDFEKFHESKKIIAYLNDVPCSKRKTLLSALVVVTNLQEYRTLMVADLQSYRNNLKLYEKTDKQVDSWVTFDEVKSKLEELRAEPLMRKRTHSMEELMIIQNYVILCLTSGVYIPPRRSKDWTEMAVKNVPIPCNYMDNNVFYYSVYKTANTYGLQTEEIPKVLGKILKRWIKISKNDYLLFDINGKKLTSDTLNKKINKIFGKNVGTSQLRHSYLDSLFHQKIAMDKSIESTMKSMGSSPDQLIHYIKI